MLYPYNFLLIIKSILRKECNYLYRPIICAFYYTQNYMCISLSSLFLCISMNVCVYMSTCTCVCMCVFPGAYVETTGWPMCLLCMHLVTLDIKSECLLYTTLDCCSSLPFIFTRQFSNFISLYFQTGSC